MAMLHWMSYDKTPFGEIPYNMSTAIVNVTSKRRRVIYVTSVTLLTASRLQFLKLVNWTVFFPQKFYYNYLCFTSLIQIAQLEAKASKRKNSRWNIIWELYFFFKIRSLSSKQCFVRHPRCQDDHNCFLRYIVICGYVHYHFDYTNFLEVDGGLNCTPFHIYAYNYSEHILHEGTSRYKGL